MRTQPQKHPKLYLGLILFFLGLAGILSLLTMEIPLPEEARQLLEEQFSAEEIKLLTLVNPTIMLIVATIVGTLLYNKVNLSVPIIEGIIGKTAIGPALKSTFKYGVIGGIIAGVLISLTSLVFNPFLPATFLEFGESFQQPLAARFLYGGITEEILLRFGLMTFLVWAFSRLFKSTGPAVYWAGIFISAIIFAIGHFPIAFQAVESPSAPLISYILIGNSVGGIIFGWLYWKKGLEAAFFAHIFAHIVMVTAESLLF